MVKIWLVFCPHCNRPTTSAPPPGSADFSRYVRCVLCNRKIDAKEGHVSIHPRIVKQKKFNLLEVH